MKKLWMLLGVTLALLSFSVMLAQPASADRDDRRRPTRTPTPTRTRQPTQTHEPTATRRPTRTPTQPAGNTATPVTPTRNSNRHTGEHRYACYADSNPNTRHSRQRRLTPTIPTRVFSPMTDRRPVSLAMPPKPTTRCIPSICSGRENGSRSTRTVRLLNRPILPAGPAMPVPVR